MKVERIYTESASVFNSVSADKIFKEEKQVLSTDAVILDSEKQSQNQFQPKQEKNEKDDSSMESPSKENIVHVKEIKGLGKKIDVIA